jgi:hypothetical protein
MELKVSDHLEKFYLDYNLGENGGNHLPYVTLKIGKFFKFYIPNWDNRRRAVLRHDIHHLLTGYKSELLGEFEIAAWEIGSGCMDYFAAYLLNSGGLLAGLLIYPRPSFKAFLLGCRTTNLYQLNIDDKSLKNSTIEELRKQIGLNPNPSLTEFRLLEILKLSYHMILGIFLQTVVLILSPLLILYNIWMHGKRLFRN